jgi:uncharacterized protein
VAAEPQRTCTGCRATAAKRELFRVVRTPEGEMRADPEGSAPGRGAYVHRSAACIDAALRHGGLARSVRAKAGPGFAGRLMTLLEGAVTNA